MLKMVPAEVWVFDVEWVPDVASGRRVYGLPAEWDDRRVLDEMWTRGGASEDDPRPYLKTVVCRVVSISAVIRRRGQDGTVSLRLHSLPGSDATVAADEAGIIARFLGAAGKAQPQLVGFNSHSADLVILLQRALAHRLSLPDFCRRPAKPWEGVDYFARGHDFNVDLKDDFGGWGKATPSLHELATVCGIPGKLGTDGRDVVDLWLDGDTRRIVQYNQCDAISTYLLWLRAALLAGHLDGPQHEHEESQLEALLEDRAAHHGDAYLAGYLAAWRALRSAG